MMTTEEKDAFEARQFAQLMLEVFVDDDPLHPAAFLEMRESLRRELADIQAQGHPAEVKFRKAREALNRFYTLTRAYRSERILRAAAQRASQIAWMRQQFSQLDFSKY